jgi:plastocyanin
MTRPETPAIILPHAPALITRRAFIHKVGSTAAILTAATLLGDCGGGLTSPADNTPKGSVKGTVVDLQGNPQAIGRVFLLTDSGLNNGLYADVDAAGAFDLGAVDIGAHQVRYWGGNQADVPETFDNPVRITVAANQTVTVDFHIQLGGLSGSDREIYAGDFFYQEQPTGLPNATVVVPLGTGVCWYNVGRHTHTVTGGPWGDSGDIAPLGNFMWTSDQVGTFPYRCTYHSPDMQATLQVVPA